MTANGTVFIDVDTQVDFLSPEGALYVPGAEGIVDRIATLNRYAASHHIPVISTMDAHTPDDPEFRDWPPHCVAGTPGQRKPEETLLDGRAALPNRPVSAAALSVLGEASQVLLEKQALDCFTNPNLPALLDRLGARRCVVYGVVTEICVKHAAMGLLDSGRRVELVADAVQHLNQADRDSFFDQFTAAGGILTTAAGITGSRDRAPV